MVRDQLFRGEDIYGGITFDRSKVDIQGWGSDHPILPYFIKKLRPTLVIEVGTWKGRSALNMAKSMQDNNINGEVLCIDTWLGSPEHWLASGERRFWRDSLRIVNGQPTLYQTFLQNVIHKRLQQFITPFPVPSGMGFLILKEMNVKAELIYIDAGHDYDSVKRDIESYWQLLEKDGVLILDDYMVESWRGLYKAVNEFASDQDLFVYGEKGKAVLSKRQDLGISNQIVFW